MNGQAVSPRLTPAFVDAIQYAMEKHGTPTRKGSDIPYLGHLLSVAGLVIDADGTETPGHRRIAARRRRRPRR